MNLIQVSDLTFNYNSNKVLDSLNFDVKKGEYIAIIGENGSGKSTLIKILLGFYKNYEGGVKLFGSTLKDFQDWIRIGYVPQIGQSQDFNLHISVSEIFRTAFFKGYKKNLDYQTQLQKIDKFLGILDLLDLLFSNLSGGQKQKVMLARSLINAPEILILDEPVSGIDVNVRLGLTNFLSELNQQGLTILHITHDLDRLKKVVDRVLCIEKNQLNENKKGVEHVHA